VHLFVLITETQPNAAADMLRLVEQSITQSQARIPALERTVQEIKMEWNLL